MEPSQIPTSSPSPILERNLHPIIIGLLLHIKYWVQVDEIEWDCSKLIEITNVDINAVEVQGIWEEEDEFLKEAVAIWGILPK